MHGSKGVQDAIDIWSWGSQLRVGECQTTTRIIEEGSSIFDHSFFCDAWQWIYLATSMCQQADQQLPMVGHCIYEILLDAFTLCNLICGGMSLDGSHVRTIEAWCQWVQLSRPLRLYCRLQGATIAIPSKSGSYTKTYNMNSTTTLPAGGYNEDGPVSLSCRPACMSLYLAIGYLLMTEDVLGFATSS